MSHAEPTDAEARPSLRERNRIRTRETILQACLEIQLVHHGFENPEVFTYARIAEIAGMSERTVYRVFPTKADLTHAYFEARTLLGGRTLPPSLEDYPDLIRDLSREWTEKFPDPIPSFSQPGTGDLPEARNERRERDKLVSRQAQALIPDHLPDRQRLALTAILQSVASVRSLAGAASRWQLTLAETGEAQAWALEAILHALNERPPEPWTLPPPPPPPTSPTP